MAFAGMNLRLNDEKNDRDEQQDAPGRRKFHQQRLEERPTCEERTLPPSFFAADYVPIHIFRVEAVARFRFGAELSPELFDFEAFGDARPEIASAGSHRAFWRGCGMGEEDIGGGIIGHARCGCEKA